jgi:hypothetical protein
MGIVLYFLGQKLKGDVAVEDRISGKINFAHSSRAEKPDQFIMIDAVPGVKHFSLLRCLVVSTSPFPPKRPAYL